MIKRVVAVGSVLLLIAVGFVAYSFFKPPKEASGPIEAIPVVVDQPTTPPSTAAPGTEESEPMGEATATTVAMPTGTSEPEPTEAPQATELPKEETDQPVSGFDDSDTPIIFEIVQADSEVRFIINEVLNGAPKTVVGVTDQVAGEIAIYVDAPSQTKIGTILVNARTLTTDNEFRNRAIKNRILITDDYEFINFAPSELIGLPDSVTVGESFAFQILGDLTVRDVTRPVTFDATVTPNSERQLTGNARTTILYTDFGLVIPEAPAVASVEDEVTLEIDFVAVAK